MPTAAQCMWWFTNDDNTHLLVSHNFFVWWWPHFSSIALTNDFVAQQRQIQLHIFTLVNHSLFAKCRCESTPAHGLASSCLFLRETWRQKVCELADILYHILPKRNDFSKHTMENLCSNYAFPILGGPLQILFNHKSIFFRNVICSSALLRRIPSSYFDQLSCFQWPI